MGSPELPKLYFTVEELASRWSEHDLTVNDVLHYIETGVLSTAVLVNSLKVFVGIEPNLKVFVGIKPKRNVFLADSETALVGRLRKIFFDVTTISGAYGISVSEARGLLSKGELALSHLSDQKSGYPTSKTTSIIGKFGFLRGGKFSTSIQFQYSEPFYRTRKEGEYLYSEVSDESADELRTLYKALLRREIGESDRGKLIYKVLPKFYTNSELLSHLPGHIALSVEAQLMCEAFSDYKLKDLTIFYDVGAQTAYKEDIRVTPDQKEAFEGQFIKKFTDSDLDKAKSTDQPGPFILQVNEPQRLDFVAEIMIIGARELAMTFQRKPTAMQLIRHISKDGNPFGYSYEPEEEVLITDSGDKINKTAFQKRFRSYFNADQPQ